MLILRQRSTDPVLSITCVRAHIAHMCDVGSSVSVMCYVFRICCEYSRGARYIVKESGLSDWKLPLKIYVYYAINALWSLCTIVMRNAPLFKLATPRKLYTHTRLLSRCRLEAIVHCNVCVHSSTPKQSVYQVGRIE